jgi:hypothetical protein
MHTWGAAQSCGDEHEGAGGLVMAASNGSIEPSGPGDVPMMPSASSIEPVPEPMPLEPEDPVAPREASPDVSVAPSWLVAAFPLVAASNSLPSAPDRLPAASDGLLLASAPAASSTVSPDLPPQAKRVSPRQRPTTAQAHQRSVENVTCMGVPRSLILCATCAACLEKPIA